MDRNRPPLSWSTRILWRGIFLAPILFLVVFFFYPLLSILAVSFVSSDGTLNLQGVQEVFRSSYYLKTIAFTVWQAILSTALTIALAIPGAFVFSRYDFPGKSVILSLSVLPFILPTVVVSAAFRALVGQNGLLNTLAISLFDLTAGPIHLERTFSLILIAHVFYNYPLALRMLHSYWSNLGPSIEEAAYTLGSHAWRHWLYVRIPLLRPILYASALLVFTFTFTSFGVILILGGPEFATLEVEIYRQTLSLFNLPVAATLALVQLSALLVLMIAYARLQATLVHHQGSQARTARKPRHVQDHLLISANLTFMALLLFSPLVALAWRSVTAGDGGLTFKYYAMLATNTRGSILFVPPLEAIGNSILFAGGATLLAGVLGFLAATMLSRNDRFTRWLDPVFMLPLATSAVTLGFGYIIALDEPPLNLRTSPLLVLFAHVLIAMPFVIRSVLPALRAVPAHTREAAQVLGASPWQVWRRVDLPLISRGLAVGGIFSFTVSMGEFGATVFVARPETPTLPIAIYRLLSQPGASNYGQALALSVILAGVCSVAFLLMDRLQGMQAGEL